jgi:hypothetical protein
VFFGFIDGIEQGDVVLAHYSLAHSIAPNSGHDIRYMVYFRINLRADELCDPVPMLNIWTDYSPKCQEMV